MKSVPFNSHKLKKKHTHNVRRVKRLEQYTAQELASLFQVHKNTVSNWMRKGLRKIDDQKPHLFRGADVIAFLQKRQSSRKHSCAAHEFYCFKCKAPRTPWGGLVERYSLTPAKVQLKALCAVCEGTITKITTPEKAHNITHILEQYQRDDVSLEDSPLPRLNCDIKGS
jgi:hypothetical protein